MRNAFARAGGDRLNDGDQLVAHRVLKGAAHREHLQRLAVVGERALGLGQAVAQRQDRLRACCPSNPRHLPGGRGMYLSGRRRPLSVMEDVSDHTFLFAGLVGYSALAERDGDEIAADVAVAFHRLAARTAAACRCELVKVMGGAVMIRGCDPAAVVGVGTALASATGRPAVSLPAQVGIHTGAAVERRGDWYGATVNVAARLSAQAAAGEVLMSAATHERLAATTHLAIADRGWRRLKNVTAPLAVAAAA
jgi:class 3 adenylate cyclase